jgi:death on curing protein
VTRPEPHWLGRLAVDEAHFRQVREHGGAHGIRDEGALESALARPRQRWQYEPESRLADLAAAYGFGLVQNHPYIDGNKRVGLVAMAAFLDLNRVEITASNAEAVTTIMALARGDLSETALADWIEDRSTVRAEG